MKPLKDKEMLEKLIDRENIPLLEMAISHERERLSWLNFLKYSERQDLGEEVSRKDLPDLFTEVKAEVDKFLGTEDVKPCRIGYKELGDKTFLTDIAAILGLATIGSCLFSAIVAPDLETAARLVLASNMVTTPLLAPMIYTTRRLQGTMYTPLTECILLEKELKTSLVPAIAHEYAHHAQKARGILSAKAYDEGIARGVERKISYVYAEKEGNELYMHDITELNLPEIGKTYVAICNALGRTPGISTPKGKIPEPDSHAIGNTYFLLEEMKHGNGIYKELLRGAR